MTVEDFIEIYLKDNAVVTIEQYGGVVFHGKVEELRTDGGLIKSGQLVNLQVYQVFDKPIKEITGIGQERDIIITV